jgi:hypothetical protein
MSTGAQAYVPLCPMWILPPYYATNRRAWLTALFVGRAACHAELVRGDVVACAEALAWHAPRRA